MPTRKSRPIFFLVLAVLLFAPASSAMNMPHYDVDSLVYMSTDIVTARISENPDHKFTATVTESLYGSLLPGDRLDGLTSLLTLFAPMEDGMRVVLFLDQRSRLSDFHPILLPSLWGRKAPFVVPFSGVYLIDRYGHVHEYYQECNPGPYVAQHYSYCMRRTVPTKAQDLSLPTLGEIKRRIARAVEAVQPVRHVLDKIAVHADAPALLRLANRASNSRKDCSVRMAQGITERAIQQIQSLNDPELLLRALAVSNFVGYYPYPFKFIVPASGGSNEEFTNTRVKFLVQTFSNRREPLALRITAVRILLNVADLYELATVSPRPVLSRNSWLAGYAAEIQDTSKKIFNDTAENPRLRALCLLFLSLNNPETLADVRRVYRLTTSQELRFAIEVDFLKVSDALYRSLDPPGGPVASIVGLTRENGCEKETYGSDVFLAKFRQRKDFRYSPGANSTGVAFPRPALTNLRTGRHFELPDIRQPSWWIGARQGEFEFQVRSLSGTPPGRYSLALEYAHNNKILSIGYGVKVSIRKTSRGKELSVENPAQSRLGRFFHYDVGQR